MKYYLLTINLLLLTISRLEAQTTDSVRVEYSTDTVWVAPTSQPKTPRRAAVWYRRFIRAQHQELTLIKISGLPFFGGGIISGSYWGYNAQMGIERKLSPAFSVNAVNLIYYQNFRNYADYVNMRAFVGGRWYYSMNRRMEQGKSANNISANYLTINGIVPIWRRVTLAADLSRRNPYAESILNTRPEYGGILLGWGMQRRLGGYGYFDLFAGPYKSFEPGTSLNLSVNFAIGVGL
jgi:hypothetical protein